ncbi:MULTISPECIES: glutathione S-transferase family protein [unclassified Methylibium]|uniref:glutathione S-transferase family protein n=1 Tax=unclassified Methylibium TaxID=2633235 RepID=UPI0003F3E322|nr:MULTISPECIES: glutathione S-transferase family protein [unclassified Methylibium]EWS56238.1 Stringent starvation protein A [Methylibium sp. T29]EWS60617.1 Stringent starvation protein A [Methylibium sp. T29-B]
MLELYTHPMSPCAQKVRIVLAEKKLEWIKHHVDLSQKENLRPEYLKLNPLGVVPTLVHDGRPVIESSVICEYLDDAYPVIRLKPSSAYALANMRLWMKHVDNKLHPSCGALQWPLVMRPALMEKGEEEREALLARIPEKPRRERQRRLVKFGLEAPDVVDAVHVYRRTILDMEAALAQHHWMVGDVFSLADVCLAPYFQTVLQFGWTAMYDDCPRVADWFSRCRERESYEGSVTRDFAPEVQVDLLTKGESAWRTIRTHLASFDGSGAIA